MNTRMFPLLALVSEASGGAPPPSANPEPAASPEPASGAGDWASELKSELSGEAPAPETVALAPNPDPAAPSKPDAPQQNDPHALPARRALPAGAAKPVAEKKTGAAALREELDRTRTELEEIRKTIPKPGQPAPDDAEHPAVVKMKAERDRIAARAKELEDGITAADYRQSTEFKEKYLTPYYEVHKRAISELESIPVADGSRKANVDDFNSVFTAPTLVEASRLAGEIYGDYKEEAMSARSEVMRVYRQMKNGEAQAATLGAQRKERDAESAEQNRKDTHAAFWKSTEEAMTRDDEVWKADDTDPQGKELIASGRKLITDAFINPEKHDAKTVMRNVSEVAARAAGFARLYAKHQSVLNEMDALKDRLSKYEEATPAMNGDGTNKPGSAATGLSMVDELRSVLGAR